MTNDTASSANITPYVTHFNIADDLLFGPHPMILSDVLTNTLKVKNPFTTVNDVLASLALLTEWMVGGNRTHPENKGALMLHRNELRKLFVHRHEDNEHHPFNILFTRTALYRVNEHSFGYSPQEWVLRYVTDWNIRRQTTFVEALQSDEARALTNKVNTYVTTKGKYLAKSDNELASALGMTRRQLKANNVILSSTTSTKQHAMMRNFYKSRIGNMIEPITINTRSKAMLEVGITEPDRLIEDFERVVEQYRYTDKFNEDAFTDELTVTTVDISEDRLVHTLSLIKQKISSLMEEVQFMQSPELYAPAIEVIEKYRDLEYDCNHWLNVVRSNDVKEPRLMQIYQTHKEERRYVRSPMNPVNIQQTQSNLRDMLLNHCTQLDINAAVQSAIVGICARHGLDLRLMRTYVKGKTAIRGALAERTMLSVDRVKQCINSVPNGYRWQGKTRRETDALRALRDTPWMEDYMREVKLAKALVKEHYCVNLRTIAQKYERMAVDVARKHLDVEVLVHDAVYVSGEVSPSELASLNKAVERELGFRMAFDYA